MVRTRLSRYAIAAVVILLTVLVQQPIARLIGPGPPLIFFVPAVTLSAWLGGGGPGLLATALAAIVCDFAYFAPIGSLAISNPNDFVRLGAFLAEGVLTSVLMEWLHRARRRADESRREAEEVREASRRVENWLEAIIDNTNSRIYIKNTQFRYIMMNKKLMGLLGVTPDEVPDLCDYDLFPREVADVLRANDQEVIRERKSIEFEENVPEGWGKEMHAFMSLKFPLLDQAGVPYAVGGVSTDITPLKDAQRRAVQAERLAAVGQMVAGLAHESRNALQRSQACLEMLAGRVSDRPEAIDLVARIQQAQDDLHSLYEQVRCYASPILLDRRSCRIRDLLREAWAHLEPSRAGRDVRLRETGHPELTCSGDGFRLIQVFRNILDNSLAAARDPVVIDVEWQEDARAGKPTVGIVIRDNGPGFTPKEKSNLFEPFFTTKIKGTGLGMAIAKRIIEAHEGEIVAGPVSGCGATIRITLPRGDQ